MQTDLLRRAREAKGLTLPDLAKTTRIAPWVLRKLDDGQFSALPAGIYARNYLKAFASAVGLDPESTLAEFEELLPLADSSTTTLARIVCQRRGEPAPDAEPPRTSQPPRAGAAPAAVAQTEEDLDEPVRPSGWRLYGAAVTDAIVLSALQFAVLDACALVAGLTVRELMMHAPWPLGVVGATMTAIYFGFLGGIAGRTCGAWLAGIQLVPPAAAPLDLSTVVRRSAACLIRELSVLVGVVLFDAVREKASNSELARVRTVSAKAHLAGSDELPVSRIVGI